MLDEVTKETFDRLYKQGCDDRTISEATFYSYDTIRAYRRHLGLPSNLQKQLARRKELYDLGMSDRQIGEEIGFSASCVGQWRIRNGLTINRSRKNHNFIHSGEDKNNVIQCLENNPDISVKGICKIFGYSTTFVRNTLRANNLMTNGQKEYFEKYKNKGVRNENK